MISKNDYSTHSLKKTVENRPKKVFLDKNGKIKRDENLPIGFFITLTIIFLIAYLFFSYVWFN